MALYHVKLRTLYFDTKKIAYELLIQYQIKGTLISLINVTLRLFFSEKYSRNYAVIENRKILYITLQKFPAFRQFQTLRLLRFRYFSRSQGYLQPFIYERGNRIVLTIFFNFQTIISFKITLKIPKDFRSKKKIVKQQPKQIKHSHGQNSANPV